MTFRLDTKSAILEAGFLVFSNDPSSSLAVVAKEAGVGRATLHRHFANRADLLNALTHKAITELNQAVDDAIRDAKSHTEALKSALRAMVPLGHRQWFLNFQTAGEDKGLESSLNQDREALIAAISAAKTEGTFPAHVAETWVAEAFDALLYTAWTLVRHQQATPDQATEFVWNLLTSQPNGGQK